MTQSQEVPSAPGTGPGLTRWWMRPVLAVRRSLATRTALLATGIGIVLIILLLLGVTTRIRDDVFEDRRDVILADARQRVAVVQAELDQTKATTPDEVAVAAQAQVTSLKSSSAGAGVVGVVMVSSSQEATTTAINDLSTDTRLEALITPALSSAVDTAAEKRGAGRQFWQSVSVPSADGHQSAPGIIVASRAVLPVAGEYDLYLVYSLEPEQRIITLAARAVTLAAIGFLLMLILGVWALTWRVLIPVRRTSLAAQRLAAGHLAERLVVAGEDEIAVLSQSFNHMADSLESQIDQLQSLSELQRLFVSDVSHELRTPLSSILLASEQIMNVRDEIDDPLAVRSIDLLQEQVDRFARMLEDLLAISKIDSGRVRLAAEETDLRGVLTQVLADVRVQVEERDAVVTVSQPESPVIAEMDSVRIERVIRNLVTNALDHARPGQVPRLEVVIAENEDVVALRVRDHGVGMSPDVSSKVFDRFYRADPSRKRTLGGTGLGLSISLEDAHLHGGVLENWGWPDDGASFLLVLPRVLGPENGPGTLCEPWPLSVVPPDAPVVARSGSRREAASAAQSTVIGPVPVSRRAEVVRGEDAEDLPGVATPELPGPGVVGAGGSLGLARGTGSQVAPPPTARRRVVVHGPDDAPSTLTPDAPGGRA